MNARKRVVLAFSAATLVALLSAWLDSRGGFVLWLSFLIFAAGAFIVNSAGFDQWGILAWASLSAGVLLLGGFRYYSTGSLIGLAAALAGLSGLVWVATEWPRGPTPESRLWKSDRPRSAMLAGVVVAGALSLIAGGVDMGVSTFYVLQLPRPVTTAIAAAGGALVVAARRLTIRSLKQPALDDP